MVEVRERSLANLRPEDELYKICEEAKEHLAEAKSPAEVVDDIVQLHKGVQLAHERKLKNLHRFEELYDKAITYNTPEFFCRNFTQGSNRLLEQSRIDSNDDLVRTVIDLQDQLFEYLDNGNYGLAPQLLSKMHAAHRMTGHTLEEGKEIGDILRETYHSFDSYSDKRRLVDAFVNAHTASSKTDIEIRYQSQPG